MPGLFDEAFLRQERFRHVVFLGQLTLWKLSWVPPLLYTCFHYSVFIPFYPVLHERYTRWNYIRRERPHILPRQILILHRGYDSDLSPSRGLRECFPKLACTVHTKARLCLSRAEDEALEVNVLTASVEYQSKGFEYITFVCLSTSGVGSWQVFWKKILLDWQCFWYKKSLECCCGRLAREPSDSFVSFTMLSFRLKKLFCS